MSPICLHVSPKQPMSLCLHGPYVPYTYIRDIRDMNNLIDARARVRSCLHGITMPYTSTGVFESRE